LKGASAAAIYGSKAANGVILITTRRGRVGSSQFHLTQDLGFSSIAHRQGMRQFNSEDEAVKAFGASAANIWKPGAFYDDEYELFGGKPLSSETTGSLSGGTETTQYHVSGLVKHDGGILVGTGYDKQS